MEQAEKLLSLSGLGGGTALELMQNMLSLLGSNDGGLLFIHLFLRQLPVAVRTSLANFPFLAAQRSLAEEVDRILLVSRTFGAHAPAAKLPATPPPAFSGADALALMAGTATQQHRRKRLCFYHQHFGASALHYLPPCSFSGSGKRGGHRAVMAMVADGMERLLFIVHQKTRSGRCFLVDSGFQKSLFPPTAQSFD